MNNLPFYCTHDDKQIKGFRGDFRFLSNFWDCPVWYEGLIYPNSECAYQASKIDPRERQRFQQISASDSKKMIKKFYGSPLVLNTPEEWDKIKGGIMCSIVFEKFYRNLDLRQKLLETGNKYIEESNCWHDNWFGVCYCGKCKDGQNQLGKILMKVREFWK